MKAGVKKERSGLKTGTIGSWEVWELSGGGTTCGEAQNRLGLGASCIRV
jgi:hypothetical protein